MIPVSVITGYLGSGKTTILKKLLANPDYCDTAVIINEFGEIGLDHDLIETSDEDLVTLKTGCLCCKMRGDLGETLDGLLARREAGEISSFKRVIIETSGVADPVPILQGLMVDPSTIQNFQLERVITAVDAVSGANTIKREPEAAKQIAVADRLVLTKTDLADAENNNLASLVRELNPSTEHVAASYGEIAPSVLFADHQQATPSSRLEFLQSIGNGPISAADHTSGAISTFALVRDQPIPAVALTLFLEALADHCGEGLLRLKGLVQIEENMEQPAVIHGVQHVFHPPTWLEQWPSQDQRTRMVFIGRNLSEEWVHALLRAIEREVREFAEHHD
ncbi:MAG: GTP-binding protein [Pseudomonadota bacterium]